MVLARLLLPLALACVCVACSGGSVTDPPDAQTSGPDAGHDGGQLVAQDAGQVERFEDRLAQLVSPYVDPSGAPGKAVGLVVGVSAGNTRVVAGFGATEKGGSTHVGPDTIFEIGSVTKVYTGVLLGLEVNRGNLRLIDPIDPYFPAGAPSFGARSINLLDLATHTAGLPDMPTNLHSTEPGNPAAGYTAADLAEFMSSYSLTVAPGTTFRYSNVGAGTVGYLLVRETQTFAGYGALLKRELADPLGASDTTTELSAEQRTRLAQGHRSGQPAPENDIGEPLKGSGALRSTGEEVLQFVEAALGEGPEEIVAAWQLAMEPRRPSSFGENGRTGLLINVEDYAGRTVYSKNGQTAGFSSQIIFTTSPPAAVVLLSNVHEQTSSGALRELGLSILSEVW